MIKSKKVKLKYAQIYFHILLSSNRIASQQHELDLLTRDMLDLSALYESRESEKIATPSATEFHFEYLSVEYGGDPN